MDTKRKLSKPRKKRSIAIRLDLYQWIEEQIEKSKFRNFSHAVELSLEKLKAMEKEGKNKD